MKINGARALILSLIENGIDTIFGIPGGVVIPIYDALYDFDNVKSILMRHEQGASHAADGYARATGRLGCCFATSGPGATNIVTGLATAMMDSVPMIAITGQVRTNALGKDSFQEADIIGITLSATKHNYLVKDVKDLPRIISEACYVATTGRPGPVLVDIPMDVSVAEIDYEPYGTDVSMRSYKPQKSIDLNTIDAAVKLINESEKSIFYVGGGAVASGAKDILLKLAEKCNIHVTNTLMAKGIIDENHRLSLGMLGMHGTAYANHAVHNCDLLIAVGARFDDRVTGKLSAFAQKAKVIHIDIDAAEVDKVVSADIAIIGDAKEALELIYQRVNESAESNWDKYIHKWKENYPLYVPTDKTVLYPQQVIQALSDITDGRDIVTTDVGQNQMWTALYYKVREPRHFITSGGLGTMGFGLPSAVGAAFGTGERVWAVCGDGGFQMTNQELAICNQYKLPVKIILLNNECLGMVRQWQDLFWDKRFSGIDLSSHPDYIKLADAYGIKAIRVTSYEELYPAMKEAYEYNEGTILLEFTVCKENVFPMIPAGQSIEEMMVNRPKIKL